MNSIDLKDKVKLGIAGRLRQERERLGFTQSQLADQLGVTRFTISNYESGWRMPTADQLYSMGAIGFDTSLLLNGNTSLSTSDGLERFEKTLNILREHCRLSKLDVPDNEIIKAAIFLADGVRNETPSPQRAFISNLGTLAIQSLFESLKVGHE